MAEVKWDGRLGPMMKKHIQLREAVGRVIGSEVSVLSDLNYFLKQNYPKANTLNRMIIMDYFRSKPNLKPSGKRNYLSHIRQFCHFLNQRGIDCYVPDKTLLPKHEYKARYYPLYLEDVRIIMLLSKTVRADKPFIGEVYSTIFGLLYCTGMRRREVVNLNHEDVDLNQGVLVIRQTKFFKDRIIPLNESVIAALKDYKVAKQEMGYEIEVKKPFFINLKGDRLPGHTITTVLKRVVKMAGFEKIGDRHPAVHDFRHNFATQMMEKFFSDPERYPGTVFMPRLATYLGHTNISYTQYYLHPHFDLMQKSARKFKPCL